MRLLPVKIGSVLLFCIGSFAARAQLSDSLARPGLLATLRPGHPRLYVTGLATFDSLRQRLPTDPFAQRCADSVTQKAVHMLNEPVCQYVIPDGKRLLNTSRRVADRALTLGMAYRLTGDKRYAERLYADLEAASRFPDWNPTHFLDTGEMTHAFAIGYDWLYDVWTPTQRKILKSAILEKGLLRAYLAYTGRATQETSWWPAVEHNWNQVCNGGIGMGALAIADEEPKLSEDILQNVVRLLPKAMQHYGPDGAWNEGPGYWSYATQYNVAILAGLQSALGHDAGLSRIPGFDQAGMFPVYATGPMNRTFNYADASDGTVRSSNLFWLARRFGQPALLPFGRKWASYSALDLLWSPAGGSPSTTPTLPLDRYFRASEVVTLRSRWEDPNALFVAFKAGDNAANHSNLDLGSFVLDANGYRWAVDLGAENYNLPNYFQTSPDGQRWTYYRMRAESHNTLVLNPSAKADQHPKAKAKVVRYNSKPDRAFGIMDLTPAYDRQAQRVRRGIALLNRQTVLVQDEVTADKPTDVYWFMQTPAQVTLSADGRSATLTQGDEQLTARLVTPANARFEVGSSQPLSTSPRPAGINENKGIQRLSVHLPAMSTGSIAVEFVPKGTRSRMKAVRALDNW